MIPQPLLDQLENIRRTQTELDIANRNDHSPLAVLPKAGAVIGAYQAALHEAIRGLIPDEEVDRMRVQGRIRALAELGLQ